MARNAYTIGIYEVDRAYGGPEEGGWWYDTGTLVHVYRVVKNEDTAYAIARRYNHLLRLVQRGQREVSSVCYNGGRCEAHVHDYASPMSYPEVRPHYE